MDDSVVAPSSQLLAANERLLALRARRSAEKVGEGLPRPEHLPVAAVPSTRPQDGLPAHLGWESEPLTINLRAAQQRREQAKRNKAASAQPWPAAEVTLPQSFAPEPPPPAELITLYPDLALALLRNHQEAPGRVWLLLRRLDKPGRGSLALAEARQQLTHPDSPFHFCTWRQLRNLLHDGQGVFWEIGNGYIWLHSLVRVADDLGVNGFQNHPVEIPLTALLGGMGNLRAHLYASFHSGRDGDEAEGRGHSKPGRPIARSTLSELSGVGRCSQRHYEKRTKVQVTTNYAIGEVATPDKKEARSWEKGTAIFQLEDYIGKQGSKKKKYMAWQMPNSYSGPHHQQNRGRKQRRFNSKLADLRMKRNVGNGQEREAKHYFENGKLAGKAYNRDCSRDCYYPAGRTRRQAQIWQVLGSRK